jgi:hypothetical protein
MTGDRIAVIRGGVVDVKFDGPVPRIYDLLYDAGVSLEVAALISDGAWYLFACIFRAGSEALATETRSVRQNEITTALQDVIIGFEALKKNRHRTATQPPKISGGSNLSPNPERKKS